MNVKLRMRILLVVALPLSTWLPASAQVGVPLEQPPSSHAAVYASVGVLVGDEESGWSKSIQNTERERVVEFQKGSALISVFDDGSFRSVANEDRAGLVDDKVKQGGQQVLVTNEEQAFQRAQSALTNLNLWRSSYRRGRCTLGATDRPDLQPRYLDGVAVVHFESASNNIEVSPGGTVTLELSMFSGDLISISVPHTYAFPSGTPLISDAQARAAATSLIQSLPPTDPYRQECIDALPSAAFKLFYLEAPSPSNPYNLALGYTARSGAIVIDVNANTGTATISGHLKGSSDLIPDAGSIAKQTVAKPATPKMKEPRYPVQPAGSNTLLQGGLAGLTLIALLLWVARRRTA